MKLFLALGVLLLVSIVPIANATDPEPMKVIVCKYVGTPGVDEVLQTGDNPIQVSDNAIPGFTGSFPYEFADAQGRSLAVRFAVSVEDRGELSDCPPPIGPPPFDQCPDIPGNQPEGFDCDGSPPPPPVDVCPNLEGNQPIAPPGYTIIDGQCVPVEINPQCPNCPPEPPIVRCPPGMVPTNGKDGESGNDECEFPPGPPVSTPTPTTPPTTTTTPPSAPICPKPPNPTVVTKTVVKWKTKVVYKTKIVVKWRTRTVYKTKCPPGYRMSERFGCTGAVQGSG